MPAVKERLQDVKLDISSESREKLIELLNQTLADSADLVSQVKQAHWNVRGLGFWQFHKMYDSIYEELEGSVDMIAERVGALGGVAHGTARMAAANSNLNEFPAGFGDGKKFTTELRDRVAAYANMLHENIDNSDALGDPTTADLLTEISRTANEQLYFLESHLH